MMVALGGVFAFATQGSVLKGVRVGDLVVGGLNASELHAKLALAAEQIQNRPVRLVAGDREWSRTPTQLGIHLDVDKTAAAANAEGKGSPWAWLAHSLGDRRQVVRWSLNVDRPKFKASVDELRRLSAVEVSNGDIRFVGAQVRVNPPAEGISLIASRAEHEIRRALVEPNRAGRIVLPIKKTDATVKKADLDRIQTQAAALLAQPVRFVFQSKTFTLPPERLASALIVRQVTDPESPGKSTALLLQADPDELENQIIAAAPSVISPPKNAYFSLSGDTVVLNPSVNGSTIDASGADWAIMKQSDPREPIPLAAKPIAPTLTTEIARGLGINRKIASFTTVFDPTAAPRVANIFRMASAIDQKVLRPGDSFSLNSATGPRTPENGYQEAHIIVDGELVPGIGGGVCQVATTLFNAVFDAGLQILERSNHSLYISNYPVGKDATVNYGDQDLRFRNDTPYGLMLNAVVTQKALTVNLFSSPLGRTVEQAATPQSNPRTPETKYIDDPGAPAGQQTVTEEGKPGFDITVTRRVISGGDVIHSDTFASKYLAWKHIVKRGTGPPAAVPAPAAAQTPAAPAPSPSPKVAVSPPGLPKPN